MAMIPTTHKREGGLIRLVVRRTEERPWHAAVLSATMTNPDIDTVGS